MPGPQNKDLVPADQSDPIEGYDKSAGKYHDRVADLSDDARHLAGSLPEGPAPDPFTLGPMTSGGR